MKLSHRYENQEFGFTFLYCKNKTVKCKLCVKLMKAKDKRTKERIEHLKHLDKIFLKPSASTAEEPKTKEGKLIIF